MTTGRLRASSCRDAVIGGLGLSGQANAINWEQNEATSPVWGAGRWTDELSVASEMYGSGSRSRSSWRLPRVIQFLMGEEIVSLSRQPDRLDPLLFEQLSKVQMAGEQQDLLSL